MTPAVYVTVKTTFVFAFPPGVVIVITAVIAPAGTVVVICPSLFTVKGVVFVANCTLVVPVKADPVMVAIVPTGAPVGPAP